MPQGSESFNFVAMFRIVVVICVILLNGNLGFVSLLLYAGPAFIIQ
jgi:hypothetical protein